MKFKRLYVSVWTEEIEDCKMNFFAMQIPAMQKSKARAVVYSRAMR